MRLLNMTLLQSRFILLTFKGIIILVLSAWSTQTTIGTYADPTMTARFMGYHTVPYNQRGFIHQTMADAHLSMTKAQLVHQVNQANWYAGGNDPYAQYVYAYVGPPSSPDYAADFIYSTQLDYLNLAQRPYSIAPGAEDHSFRSEDYRKHNYLPGDAPRVTTTPGAPPTGQH